MTFNESGLYSATAFKGKVVGVTGAAGGIGFATSSLLGEIGASVLMMDCDAERLEEREAELLAKGVDVKAVVTDVSRMDHLEKAVNVLRERWGQVYGWVNNAGINITEDIATQPEEDFRLCWEVNTLAAWRSLKLTHDLFPRTGGAIVNISSIIAARTRPMNMAYTSSKAALEGLTRAMAVELAPRKIRANCIIPGSIHVQPTRRQLESVEESASADELNTADYFDRMGMHAQPWTPWRGPGDVANLIVYLVSNASPYVTGSAIHIDGALNAELRTITEVDYDVFQNEIVPLMAVRDRRHKMFLAKLEEKKAARQKKS